MSHKNAEVVRRIYDEWGRGNFRAGTELYDPNITLVIQPELPDAGAYTGTEAIATYMRSLLQAWKVFTIRAEDLQEVGDTVLVAVVQGGAGITSGIESEMRYFQLWTFRGGKIIRIESIPDADEAHDAAGLPRADKAHTT